MRNINRRESPRIDVKLRCHVTSPALWMRGAMYTENVSRSGMLVVWQGEGVVLPAPSIGQIVILEIELPANHGFGQRCIHCQASVTRVSQTDHDAPRVALRVNYMDFRSFHDRLRALESVTPIVNAWMA